MTKFCFLYEDNNNELKYNGSFIGKNHHTIKFQIYKYLKGILDRSEIIFAIHELKKDIHRVFIGKSKIQNGVYIEGYKLKSINKVYSANKQITEDFLKKTYDNKILYEKTHSYREEYEFDDLSMSETDSELEFDDDEFTQLNHVKDPHN